MGDVVGFDKKDPKVIDLTTDDEIQVRQWAIEQAVIVCGYGHEKRTPKGSLITEAQKFYDFVKKLT